MNIKILKLVDSGVPNMEALHLRVISDDNIGRYIVIDTVQAEPGKVSSLVKNAYWFPDTVVRSGDLIILYTKPGSNSQVKNPDNTTTWYFYWGHKKTLWNNSQSSAVLVKSEAWEYKAK